MRGAPLRTSQQMPRICKVSSAQPVSTAQPVTQRSPCYMPRLRKRGAACRVELQNHTEDVVRQVNHTVRCATVPGAAKTGAGHDRRAGLAAAHFQYQVGREIGAGDGAFRVDAALEDLLVQEQAILATLTRVDRDRLADLLRTVAAPFDGG